MKKDGNSWTCSTHRLHAEVLLEETTEQKEFRVISMSVRDKATGLLTGKLEWETGKRLAVVTALV